MATLATKGIYMPTVPAEVNFTDMASGDASPDKRLVGTATDMRADAKRVSEGSTGRPPSQPPGKSPGPFPKP
jgi:hypothetical protein